MQMENLTDSIKAIKTTIAYFTKDQATISNDILPCICQAIESYQINSNISANELQYTFCSEFYSSLDAEIVKLFDKVNSMPKQEFYCLINKILCNVLAETIDQLLFPYP